jgi:predicted acylesterase/phospholipase RssA
MTKEINHELINEILEAQSQKIDYIALSGGGFMAILYAGPNKALIKSGIFKYIESISGASAGSFGAIFAAFNIKKNNSYQCAYDTHIDINKNFFGDGFLMLQSTAKEGCKIFENLITKTISEYFSEINMDELINNQIKKVQQEIKNDQENKDLQDRLFKLQKIQIDKLKINQIKGETITFEELSLLRALDPEKFKGLVITATRKDNGELTVFNAQNTPNVKIIDAFRASFALPILFKPNEINGVEYIDGAFKEMLPFGHFENKNIGNNNSIGNGRILSVMLDSQDQGFDFYGHIAIHGNQEKIFSNITRTTLSVVSSIVNKIAGIGGNSQLNENFENTYQFLRKNPLNTIILKSPIILSYDAYKIIDNIPYTYRTSYVQTMQYLQNHGLVPRDKIDENLEIKGLVIRLYEELCQESGFISYTRNFQIIC